MTSSMTRSRLDGVARIGRPTSTSLMMRIASLAPRCAASDLTLMVVPALKAV
jgi:hypothetical protein